MSSPLDAAIVAIVAAAGAVVYIDWGPTRLRGKYDSRKPSRRFVIFGRSVWFAGDCTLIRRRAGSGEDQPSRVEYSGSYRGTPPHSNAEISLMPR